MAIGKTISMGHGSDRRDLRHTEYQPRIRTMKQPGGTDMCPHSPPCPAPSAPDREAAHTIVSHPEQGWSLLCNGVVMFEDTGELLPDGACIAPHRPTDLAAFDRPVGVARRHDGQAPAA
jgi:hypothetical protein